MDENQRKAAREEAKKLGIMLDEDFEKHYTSRRNAERLIEDTDLTVSRAEGMGVKTNTKELLEHMQETNIQNPDKAFEDKFGKSLGDSFEQPTGEEKIEGVTEPLKDRIHRALEEGD